MRLVVRRVEDRQFRCERRHLLRRWLAEHIAREQTVPGALADHSNFVYFMGDDGGFLTMFRGGTDPEAVAKTMTKYIQKGQS